MKAELYIGIVIIGALLVGGLMYSTSDKKSRDSSLGEILTAEEKQKMFLVAPEISSPDGFVNTKGEAVTLEQFKGKKVVLLDIWTYSCINCQRTIPRLNELYEKYGDQGLEIIGLHTPEFAFEKVQKNVEDAVARFGIKYPVVLDNDFSTWNAYENRYWPRKYLIDIDGYIVYDHIGEGGYEETEAKILELLAERALVLGEEMKPADGAPISTQVIGTRNIAQSPETYFGSLRNEYLENGTPGAIGERQFLIPETLKRNRLYLGGEWNISQESAESMADAEVVYQYNAQDVYLVAEANESTRMEVFVDGKLLEPSRSGEVDEEGAVSIKESRLYHLVDDGEPGEHTLKLRIDGEGVRLYAFTFG